MKVFIIAALAVLALVSVPSAKADTDLMEELRSLDVFRLK
jgi:hypothetical protein